MGKTVLKPCPSKPNCVCSFEAPKDKAHYIPPVKVEADPLPGLKKHLENDSSFALIEEQDNYLKLEHTSDFFKFVDDVEFLYLSAEKRLHFRSASRVGYSDLGANRKRIEKILKELKLR